MRILATSPGSLPAPETAAGGLQRLIADQLACGLDLLTDGQIEWADPVSHLPAKLTGVELAADAGFCDTQLRIRRPRIRGPFAWAIPVARPEFERAQRISTQPVKPVLTGAFTLARHSEVVDPYVRRDFARLVAQYNEALLCEVRELAAAGARVIQIDEPAIGQDVQPGDWRLLKSCIRRLNSAKGEAALLLNIGWGDPLPVLEDLLSVPAEIIAFDLTRSPRLAEVLAHIEFSKAMQLGIVDCWSTDLEAAEGLVRGVEKVLARSSAPEFHLSAAFGLASLPRESALAKLRLLAKVRDLLSGAAG